MKMGSLFYKILQLCLGEYLQLQFWFVDEEWTEKRFDFKCILLVNF
jgi:hypothetical protein